MDDDGIIELFNRRSQQALPELDKKYGKLCKSISFGILNNSEDVEECLNDSYLAIWNKIPPENPNPLSSYILRIVKNNALTKYNYKKAKKRDCTYNICLDELDSCITSPDTAESEFDALLLKECINDFLSTLDTKNRILFVKRYWFFDDTASLSKQFGISETAIRVKLTRIRKKLKIHLEKRGFVL